MKKGNASEFVRNNPESAADIVFAALRLEAAMSKRLQNQNLTNKVSEACGSRVMDNYAALALRLYAAKTLIATDSPE